MDKEQQPSMGRIVQYCDQENRLYPAMITGVYQDVGSLKLTVFSTATTHEGIDVSYRPVPEGSEMSPNSWRWMPRV